MLLFQNQTLPNISMPVHQTSQLFTNPKLCHEQEAINQSGKYLAQTRDQGITKLTLLKGLNASLMLTLLVDGINKICMMQVLISQTGFVINIWIAQYTGQASFKLK